MIYMRNLSALVCLVLSLVFLELKDDKMNIEHSPTIKAIIGKLMEIHRANKILKFKKNSHLNKEDNHL